MLSNRGQTAFQQNLPIIIQSFCYRTPDKKLQNAPGLPGTLFKNIYRTQISMHIGMNNMAM